MRDRGSIFKRCEHDARRWTRCRHAWTVVVDLGADAEGKRRQTWRTVRGSLEEAQRVRDSLLVQHDHGVLTAAPETLRSYLEDRWLPHIRTRIRPVTLDRYAGIVHRDIVPIIGDVRLGRLRPVHVQRVVDELVRKGRKPRTTIQVFRVMSSALSQAVRWQLVTVNPASAVRPPRAERPALTIPTPEQVSAILKAAEGTSGHVPLVLAATTGMRRGEVAGLRWRDVDLEEGLVRVTAALQRHDGGKLEFVEPKSARSRRTIALPVATVDLLRRHRREQTERRLMLGAAWTDLDLVVERGDGLPSDPDTISDWFGKAAKRAGVVGVRLHDLRHAYATTLLRKGVHPKIASEALGHASSGFTMDTYSHVVPSMQRQAAEAIEAALKLS